MLATGAGTGTGTLVAAAVTGALAAFDVVYGLSWRRGLDAERLVLVGIGLWYGLSSLSAYLLLRANPWDTPRIYTWLSGTTYGRTWEEVLPVAVGLVVAVPVALARHRELDCSPSTTTPPGSSGCTSSGPGPSCSWWRPCRAP